MLTRHPIASFFALTFAWTWGLAALYLLLLGRYPDLLGEDGAAWISTAGFFLAIWGPSLAALLMTAILEGRPGLRDLLGRLVRIRPGGAWWAVALGLPIGLQALAILLASPMAEVGFAQLAPDGVVPLLVFLGVSLLGGPLGEELGWRGFALPRLSRRMSPLAASLLVGAAWAAWHLPVLVVPPIAEKFLPPGFPAEAFVVIAICAAVLITWILRRGGQCLGLAVLFHLGVLWGVHVLSRDPPPALVWAGAGVYLLAALVVAAGPGMHRREATMGR